MEVCILICSSESAGFTSRKKLFISTEIKNKKQNKIMAKNRMVPQLLPDLCELCLLHLQLKRGAGQSRLPGNVLPPWCAH